MVMSRVEESDRAVICLAQSPLNVGGRAQRNLDETISDQSRHHQRAICSRVIEYQIKLGVGGVHEEVGADDLPLGAGSR